VIQQIVDHGAAAAAWAVVLFRLPALYKEKGRNERVLKGWLYALCFASSATFQIDAVFVTFDGLVGVNNLAWLVSYVFLDLTIYYACALCWRKAPRWAQAASISTIVLLAVLFPFGPGSSAERLDNVIPRNLPEMLYMGICYTYGTVMLVLIPARAFYRSYREEENALIRFRKGTLFAGVLSAIGFFVLKSAVSLISFVFPSFRPFAPAGNRLASFAVMALIVLWPVSYAPFWFSRAISSAAEYLRAVGAVRDLRPIKAWLDRYPLPVLPYRASWWARVTNPALHCYRLFVSILDGQRVLDAWFGRQAADASLSRAALQDLERLYRLLQSIPGSPDWDEVMDGYRMLGRRLRKTRSHR
jgi:hypothetical protein